MILVLLISVNLLPKEDDAAGNIAVSKQAPSSSKGGAAQQPARPSGPGAAACGSAWAGASGAEPSVL
jgi:hypothetical protein